MSTPTTCSSDVERTNKPSLECLEKAAEHIAHDLYLLRHAWVDIDLRIGWTLWFVTARALMDFFFRYERTRNRNTGKYTDDILAADYLPAGEWKPLAKMLEQEEPPEYAACRTVANKLSAHLTYSRIHLVGATPPSSAVHDYLFGVFAMWLDTLEPDRRQWFDRYLKPNGGVIPLSVPPADEGHNGGTNDAKGG